jgi:signal transduction histidine kinase/CheY-like chemotaxis protein
MKILENALVSCSEAVSIIELSSDGLISYANQHFLAFSGFRSTDIIGKSYGFLVDPVCCSDVFKDIQTTLNQGQVWQRELAIRTLNAEAWILNIIIPSLDENGKLIKSYAFLNDLSQLHHIADENHQLQQQLITAQRIENVGQLASGFAHDFNNGLMAIAGFNQLGITFIKQQQYDKALEALEKVAKAAGRASDIISKMLTYCHDEGVLQKVTTPINPAVVVEEVCNTASMLRATISTQIRLDFNNHLPHQNIGLFIDASALHQIVTNLIINAKDAIDMNTYQSGQISVDLFVDALESEHCPVCDQLISGTYLNLSISDSGIGISEDKIKRIFDSFYSTKDKDKGTGLGLAMVSSMLHQADGHIMVTSVLGQGTTFALLFPIVPLVDSNLSSPLSADNTPQRPENIKICVVDDEEDILALYHLQFSLLGYEVTAFNSALDAWAHIRETPDYFDAIITDYAMPKASGLELTHLILGIRPQKPIIICTGYSDQLKTAHDLPQGNVFLIHKPISIQQLDGIFNRIWEGKT